MYILVVTTFPNREEAEKIATVLLKEKLAACVQFFEITSKYIWKGKIEKSQEVLCFIKTKKRNFSKIEKRMRELHSYETPEIIALEIKDGNREYLKWIEDVLR